jgi:hypothetical protein
MSDNTRLPAGTADGDTYASDDISSVKFQRVKVTLGADGANDGDVSSTNAMPISGTVTANATKSSTATLSNVSNSTSSGTLLSSNSSRIGATFYNDDTEAFVYLKLGTTASSTSFTIKIAPGGYYELPLPVYAGRIDGIATAASGTLRITELT